MKKRFLVLMMALVAVCLFALTPQKAEAATIVDSGTCGTNLTWTLDDEGTLTISGTGAMENYGWYWDTPWYSNRSSIKKVVLGDSVTSIGGYAFQYCNRLTNITIPDSVTSIGGSAFYNCTSLKSITIPDSVTSIGDNAFYNCTSLTSVTIGNGVTSIGNGAFYSCYSLTSITIPDSVTRIGDNAFYGCNRLWRVYYSANEACWDLISVASGNDTLLNAAFHFSNESCLDQDKNHKCDICDTVLSNCEDSNKDHKCDYCGKTLSTCTDSDKDHKCEYCGKTISYCADSNKDHKCDICGAILSVCADKDNHYCDICGAALSTCADSNSDHDCDICGALLSHCYDEDADFVCDYCEIILPGMIDDPNAKFATTGLSLGSFIGVQSALVKNTMSAGTFDEAYFVYSQYTMDENGELVFVGTTEGTYIDAGSYLVSECLVNAKQMSDIYEITPYYVKDGITYRGVTTTTSVKAEVMKKLANIKTDAKTKALCVAMLNYGAEAQKNFQYNLDNLANSELSEAQKVLPAFDALNLVKTNTIPTTPFKPAKSGMNLGDVVYMQFLVAQSKVSASGKVVYQIPGEAAVEIAVSDLKTMVVSNTTYWIVEIPIKAKHVRSDISISFPAENYTMTCSVEAFATAKQGTSTDTLVAALMAYGDAAKAVFG